jgi:mono/diheme cytochrome c family protein
MPRRPTLYCLLLCTLAGCKQEMANQPKYGKPLSPSDFFADGRSARPLVPGTVARGTQPDAPGYATGKAGDDYMTDFPLQVTGEVLRRGQERFNIFCAVCHDRLGTGDGMIPRRGFTKPPSLLDDLSRGYRLRGRDLPLRDAPVGYYFEVVTNGFGAMPDYASQIPPADRWAVVAYVRALQLSQRATAADLPPEEQGKVRAGQGGQR